MKKWDRIRSDYEKAEAALDATASRGLRRPKEDIGRYYLWKAYHSASTADEVKDHLLYARILTRMAYENDHRVQGDMFTKYLIPALKEYDKAVAAGQQPDGEEYERVQHSVDCFLHDQQSKAAPQEEHLRMIDGHEKLGDFNFFFSKTVSFEHKGTTIRMALRTEQTEVTLRFDDVVETHVLLFDFQNCCHKVLCYRPEYSPDRVIFEMNFYMIICGKVTVESVGSAEDAEPAISYVPLLGCVSA